MRAEPEGLVEWRVQGGKRLAAGGGVVVEMVPSGVSGDSVGDGGGTEATFGAEEEARLTEAIRALEGRVSMLTLRWPPT